MWTDVYGQSFIPSYLYDRKRGVLGVSPPPHPVTPVLLLFHHRSTFSRDVSSQFSKVVDGD